MDHKKFRQIRILYADDDHEERALAKESFAECRLANKVFFVENGHELLDYLLHEGRFNAHNAPRPDLILLDLNMPKKEGKRALKKIKKDPCLRRIPVVIMTTSKLEQNVIKSFKYGVAGFIHKPITFEKLVPVIKSIGKYYFEIVIHPKDDELEETVSKRIKMTN